jgi:hypothetical protein
MHLDVLLRAAQLAGLRQEASFEFRPGPTDAQGPVIEDYLCVPRQCDAAPPRYQRASPFVALDRDLKPNAWTLVGLKRSAIAAIDPGDAGAQLQRQRPG